MSFFSRRRWKSGYNRQTERLLDAMERFEEGIWKQHMPIQLAAHPSVAHRADLPDPKVVAAADRIVDAIATAYITAMRECKKFREE